MATPATLRELSRAAKAKHSADDAYKKALVEAREGGHSMAELAQAAGVERGTVHKMLRRLQEEE